MENDNITLQCVAILRNTARLVSEEILLSVQGNDFCLTCTHHEGVFYIHMLITVHVLDMVWFPCVPGQRLCARFFPAACGQSLATNFLLRNCLNLTI